MIPLLLLAFSGSAAAAAADNWLLTGPAQVEAAKNKAATQPWAKSALDQVLASARTALKLPAEIPARGGQWPHWYSCKKDGARLQTISATEHRCPRCGTIYTGDPYDAVVVGSTHNRYSRAVRDLGLAFRFTGDAGFAQKAAAILEAYAEKYRSYPRHNVNGEDRVGGGRVMAQTLDESTWLIPIAWGYALIRDQLSTDQQARITSGLLRPAADVIREHRMGVHNIQCWKNSAVGLVGFATGSQELVKEAIDDPDRGFRTQIAKGVTGDGLWWEGSMGYHVYTMSALWPLAEAARIAGIDLYSDRYRTLYDAPLSLALPDGTAPGFNDNAGGDVLVQAPLYELAYARWKKPEYGRLVARTERTSLHALLYGVADVPEGPMIPTASSMLESAGFAILRDGGTAVAIRFGPHGGGHGHPDKLNIVTFSLGKLFGLDPGSINYGVPLHKEWYRSTVAHNTVSVDGLLQANVDGKLVRFEDNTLSAEAGVAYPGVKLARSVRLVRDGQIDDRFDCSSTAVHTYDYAFHSPGVFSSSLRFEPAAIGDSNGYQHIRNAAAAAAPGDWWARWENGGAIMTLKVKGEPGTQVFRGEGPGREPTNMVPLIVIRRKVAATAFQVTHEFTRAK